MKRLLICFITAITLILIIAAPVYAIDLPDSTPTVPEIYCWRNVLETDDFLCVILENTPYTTTPDVNYSEAFLWRFMDTDGTTELAQSLGSNYNESGYGYNVIGWYFDAASAPTWGQSYYLTLSGNPAHFASPPQYSYQINAGDYSALTDTDDVQAAIAARVLLLANDLDSYWGLTSDESLLLEIETGTVLSTYGEAFFREALYGLQAYAGEAFRLIINDVNIEDRTWNTNYSSNLTIQYSGSYIDPAMTAGQNMLDVNYNLFGLIGVIILCIGVIITEWFISGGDMWEKLIPCAAILVIAARLGVMGLGELALLAAVSWLFVDAKIWKMV